MPSIDQDAKKWQKVLAARIGAAVRLRRKALKLTAQELSALTAEHGYPISRAAISKIESNSRAGKVDSAELLILAAALDIPPVLLLVPSFPVGTGKILPKLATDGAGAVKWISGRRSHQFAHTPGVDLIEQVAESDRLRGELFKWRLEGTDETAKRLIADNETRLAAVDARIAELCSQLWGGAPFPEPDSGTE